MRQSCQVGSYSQNPEKNRSIVIVHRGVRRYSGFQPDGNEPRFTNHEVDIMKNAKRKEQLRSSKSSKGFKVQTSIRAGLRGSYNSRDSYGSEYGTY